MGYFQRVTIIALSGFEQKAILVTISSGKSLRAKDFPDGDNFSLSGVSGDIFLYALRLSASNHSRAEYPAGSIPA